MIASRVRLKKEGGTESAYEIFLVFLVDSVELGAYVLKAAKSKQFLNEYAPLPNTAHSYFSWSNRYTDLRYRLMKQSSKHQNQAPVMTRPWQEGSA